MPILVVLYKNVMLLFPISSKDYEDIINDFLKIKTINGKILMKEVDEICEKINVYKQSNDSTLQEDMLGKIAKDMSISYNTIVSTWINNVILLLMNEIIQRDDENDYFIYEDDDDISILYRAIHSSIKKENLKID